jgi:phosphopantetheinyl transferase (holo-ACP synthase)
VTKEQRKREQAQQVRARVLHELDKSAGVFAAKESFDRALIRELTVGHMPVRFSKEFIAEL